MIDLASKELMNIQGGGAFKWIMGGIAIAFVFAASVIYGYIHPNKC